MDGEAVKNEWKNGKMLWNEWMGNCEEWMKENVWMGELERTSEWENDEEWVNEWWRMYELRTRKNYSKEWLNGRMGDNFGLSRIAKSEWMRECWRLIKKWEMKKVQTSRTAKEWPGERLRLAKRIVNDKLRNNNEEWVNRKSIQDSTKGT